MRSRSESNSSDGWQELCQSRRAGSLARSKTQVELDIVEPMTIKIRHDADVLSGESVQLSGIAFDGLRCLNIYTFSPGEKLVSCCACPVFVDYPEFTVGLESDLLPKGGIYKEGSINVVGRRANGTSCADSAAKTARDGFPLVPGCGAVDVRGV